MRGLGCNGLDSPQFLIQLNIQDWLQETGLAWNTALPHILHWDEGLQRPPQYTPIELLDTKTFIVSKYIKNLHIWELNSSSVDIWCVYPRVLVPVCSPTNLVVLTVLHRLLAFSRSGQLDWYFNIRSSYLNELSSCCFEIFLKPLVPGGFKSSAVRSVSSRSFWCVKA